MVDLIVIPGRHHLLTPQLAQRLRELVDGHPQAQLVFAVHAFDESMSRRNPFPGWLRAACISAWAQSQSLPARIVPVLATGHRRSERFARYTISHLELHGVQPNPQSTLIATATPELFDAWSQAGYEVAQLELDEQPYRSLERMGEGTARLEQTTDPVWAHVLTSHAALAQLHTIFHDPMVSSVGELTSARDYNVYSRAFDEGAARKWDQLRSHVRPGVIVDLGCGPGSLLAQASRDPRLHDSDLHGVEVSATLYGEAVHRRSAGAFANAHTFFHHANVLQEGLFAPRSVHTTITASLTHEICSYGSEHDLIQLLRSIYQQSAPGGVYLNLDVCGPAGGEDEVTMVFEQRRADQIPVEQLDDSRQPPISQLDTAERWVRFASEWHGLAGAWRWGEWQGKLAVCCARRVAHEFALHKDYPDNWDSEMHEQFASWDYERWCSVLRTVGFELDAGSRAWTNEWIVTNRLDGQLFIAEGNQRVAWGDTHCLLVARRP